MLAHKILFEWAAFLCSARKYATKNTDCRTKPNCWPCAERCILFGMPVDCQFVFAKQSEIPPPYNILLICLGQHWSKTGYNGPLHTIFVRIFAFGFATTYCIFRIANKLLSSAAARKCISNLAIFSAHSIQCVYWGNLKEFIYTCRAHIHIYRYSGSKAVSKFSFFEANFRFAFACTTPTLFVVDFILCCCGLCRLWAKAYDEASNFWLFRITHFRFVLPQRQRQFALLSLLHSLSMLVAVFSACSKSRSNLNIYFWFLFIFFHSFTLCPLSGHLAQSAGRNGMQESAFGSTTANTTANNNSNWQQLHAAQAAGHVESLHATSLIFQEQANLISFFSFLHVSLWVCVCNLLCNRA